jgi:hypothetical protein
VIDAREKIGNLFIAPIGEDALAVFLAAGASPVIDRNHRIAVCGEELPFEAKCVTVLPVRAAVDAEPGRIFLSTFIRERLGNQTMDLCAVVAFETNIFTGQLQL